MKKDVTVGLGFPCFAKEQSRSWRGRKGKEDQYGEESRLETVNKTIRPRKETELLEEVKQLPKA